MERNILHLIFNIVMILLYFRAANICLYDFFCFFYFYFFVVGSVSFEFQHNVCGRSIYAEGTVDAILFLAKKVNIVHDSL